MAKTYIGFQAHGFGFEAHLTMSYLGKMIEQYEDEVHKILGTLTNRAFYVERNSINLFGPNKDIPVITVNVDTELMDLKKTLDALIEDNSSYEWNPHITLDTSIGDLCIPQRIRLSNLNLY